jgi:hypothetical protein
MLTYVLTLRRSHEDMSKLADQGLGKFLPHVLPESLVQFFLAGGILAVTEVISK